MGHSDFSAISGSYSEKSIIQKSAAEILIDLLNIKGNETILDVGCGTGKLAHNLLNLTKGHVTGIDPSEGMIVQAKKQHENKRLKFRKLSAEELDYYNEFDTIFCNSAMQWFRDIDIVLDNFYSALKAGGKTGIQAPAKKTYSPNFIRAIDMVKKDKRTKDIFAKFQSPWFFYDSAEEYRRIFEMHKFIVDYCSIDTIKSFHSPEEVFKIFSSGAAAGYLNNNYYTVNISDEYIDSFNSIIMQEFVNQSNHKGLVDLEFNRIYIIAVKS